jgi:UDP-4-amino-4,6-dideoxy-N-acetyl-beta-L-altrosamine transaminase
MEIKTMTTRSQLASHGGSPIRSQWLPYSRQAVDEADIALVAQALRGDIITRGPYVERFEKEVAELVQIPFGVAFSSATAALHAVMNMLGVKEGVKVVTSPNTFAATSNAVLYCGGQPVFCDIDEATMNLDPQALPADLGPHSIVVPVDFAGNPCEMNLFAELKSKSKFQWVEDCSHSIGATYHGRPVGAQADFSVFSFHPVKSMTTGEGGMVMCRDAAHADYLRAFRSHGIYRDSARPGYYEQRFLGYNYNITDIQCALGLSQLKRLPNFVEQRRALAMRYHEKLKGFGDLILPAETAQSQSSWHLYPLRIRFENLKVDRDEFLKALHAENIGANVHYIPVYFHPYYQSLGYQKGLCPKAERAWAQEISIPLFASMTHEDQDDVCAALEKLLTHLHR